MSGRLAGKVVMVTGAGRGQGRAHAVRMAREGAAIVAFEIADQIPTVDYPMATPADLRETVAQTEAAGGRVLAIEGDVRSQPDLDDAVRRAVEAFGRLDVLIANAGTLSHGPFWELTEQAWSEVVDVNLTGVWKSAKAVAPQMITQRGGVIVVTSSVNGLEPATGIAHYVSAKHGVLGLVKSIALELAPYGVRCNAICPGAVDTPMISNQGSLDRFAGHEGATREDLMSAGRRFHALAASHALPPEVIADAAVWLASAEASRVTGIAVPVDAGHLLLPGHNFSPVT